MMETKEKNRKAKAIIAVVNNKGGCGKSTTTFHFSGELAKRGRKVLVIDGDPQRNTSRFFLAEEESNYDFKTSKTLLDVIMGNATIEEVIKKNYIKVGNAKPRYMGIDVIPGDKDIKTQENYADIINTGKLADILNDLGYDYILIDCPPCNATMNHLVLEQWATHVLIPLSNDISSITGMSELIAEIDEARAANENLEIIGAFYSMFLPMTVKSRSYYNAMAKSFPKIFIKSYIPFCEDIKKSMEDEGRPLAFFRKTNATKQMEQLVSEVLKRL